MTVQLVNAEWLMWSSLGDVITPPPPVDHLSWAEENVVFGTESDLPGRYDRSQFPFNDRILEVLSPEHPARIVVWRKSAQLGGTVVAQIFAGSTLDQDPCDFLFVHPTEPNAKRWSKLKWKKFIRQSPALRKLFPGRSRDTSESVLFQESRDGRSTLTISGANSEASLSMISMPRAVHDDLSKWERNAAGDPETQANTRSRGFKFAKIFKTSTPLIEPGCRITRNFLKGTQEYYHVPCPQCGHFQTLEWDNMLANLEEGKPESAHFTCILNGCVIEQKHRHKMVLRGKWIAENPKATTISFHLWSAYAPIQSWSDIAAEWFEAQGDTERERVFLNDTVGLAFKFKGDAPPWEEIRDRALESHYVRGRVPAGGLVLTCGIDCQKNRVECQVIAWGRDRRKWVVEYKVIEGHISEEGTRARLSEFIKLTWRNSVGRDMPIALAAIDGNAWTEDVWPWVKMHPTSKAIMVRGAPYDTAPLFAQVKRERSRAGKLLKWSRRFFNFGASPMKMGVYRDLKKTDPHERGYIGFPLGLEDEYFRQLCSESRVPVQKRTGFVEYKWHKEPGQANEALDTFNQAYAAAIRHGVREWPDSVWDRLEGEWETPPPESQLDIEDMLTEVPPGQGAPADDGPSELENAYAKIRKLNSGDK
jgi:phage terminase large subunit GpA-like protein